MIDSHQHFWDPGRGDYGWLRNDSLLYRTYEPADLLPLLQSANIQGSILVQAAPTAAETDYLLAIAHAHSWILGVVGWVDLSAPLAPSHIEKRSLDSLFVGVRPMLQDLSDRRWILRPELRRGIDAIEERSLVFDALVRADQLSCIAELADRHPGLSIVLNHAGKPPLGTRAALALWKSELCDLANRANVACKLSGLCTEIPAGADPSLWHGCVDVLLDCFGWDRLLWGSDWPVATTAISYPGWFENCRSLVMARAPTRHDAIFEHNARRIYNLTRGLPRRSLQESYYGTS